MSKDSIRLRGARQNNLKQLDLDIPLGEMVVVTGVSGSGKSSLAFDTIYAEGQRRYVETFSPYARQFLDRMDKPAVDRIEGIPPSIAIDQVNPVRTSRSTVGTMTELNDHLKLLFARAARLFCGESGHEVRRDDPESIADALFEQRADERLQITFRLPLGEKVSQERLEKELTAQGYTRWRELDGELEVTQDRLKLRDDARPRLIEALESAIKGGAGKVTVWRLDDDREPIDPLNFSDGLHCPVSGRQYKDVIPNSFSFNSPVGACPTCRGFGRTMGIDFRRVVPDTRLSIREGAVKPWQTPSYSECQTDLVRFAKKQGIPLDTPWAEMSEEEHEWVLEGEGGRSRNTWYGVRGFFQWLETKAYKMHVRVQLARYRSYDLCPDCHGARLKPESLLWRLGSKANADAVLAPEQRFRPQGMTISDEQLHALPGLTMHDVMQLPLSDTREFIRRLELPAPLDEATELLLETLNARLDYLCHVGLGYLTLDRQSRTLSGGEVQRINLTTALGTALVNTLFVLDEPSIGLHPRDMDRIIEVMHRLRNAGNSLLVVEHDPQVMLAADQILEIGPGPGERGGELLYQGAPSGLVNHDSLTADYLCGRRQVTSGEDRRPVDKNTPGINITGARENNLRDVDVRIPLERMVVLTGVSGSGKSTLMETVLYRGLRERLGRPDELPGEHDAIEGWQLVDDVVMVDQSQIGKTARSNPASYVGAFDAIRKRFAEQPLAKERGYKIGTFSFNAGKGRCPACGGTGFEHVEMQFLSDVYLRCPTCDGSRYRPEILEVTLPPPAKADDPRPQSIADVLAMSVNQAVDFFADAEDVLAVLEPLQAVGLGYIGLGQPLPTLSGGEAQRLKLAAHLAEAARKRKGRTRQLLLFDEPTTGLHFDDIATLLKAFRRLLEAGHSLVIIEHNVDVMQAADWIIDIGPEGGSGGGQVMAEGTPDDLMKVEASHTGRALLQAASAPDRLAVADAPSERPKLPDQIRIHHAREHNLKNIDLDIPRDKLTVITGLSGSGKSTVAFDLVFNEGQRRYLESLNAYARQFVQPAAKPDVDAIFGIPPTVAIEQRTSRGGRKSTVATLTEIYHFLRLLYVKLGTQYCPKCKVPIEQQSFDSILAQLQREHRGKEVQLLAPLIVSRKGYYTDLATWALNKGFDQLRVDGEYLPTDNWPRLDRFQEHDIELPVGTIKVSPKNEEELARLLRAALDYGQGNVITVVGNKEALLSEHRACPSCQRSFPELDPRLFSFNSRHGWCPSCQGTGEHNPELGDEETGEENRWLSDTSTYKPCPKCQGDRLRPEGRNVLLGERSLPQLTALTVSEMTEAIDTLPLDKRGKALARDVLPEIAGRLSFLQEVGLGYLTLNRAAPTLSGGEAQRIRIAAQLGSNLQGVCYVMDEPTIGLHARDNHMLLNTLERLRKKGNTLVVVEHDEETIRRAEYVIDLGPGAGVRGGEVVAAGSPKKLAKHKTSLTAKYLREPLQHPMRGERRPVKDADWLTIVKAKRNNLRQLSAKLPLRRLVALTGVSGSGKSTLMRDVLHPNLKALINGAKSVADCQKITGWEPVERILEVDQTPIGKTPRSCPATYVGFWDDIRKLFAGTSEAQIRGYGPGRFSFNTAAGRCPDCQGQGVKRIEMNFLPDVTVDCDACRGDRFNPETLSVRWRDKTIGDVLNMDIDEAVDFFAAHPRIQSPLELLQDVGLGYLTLGQPSPTLSGGEAQRIKLVTELAKAADLKGRRLPPHTLYLLDEPTVGLHTADVERLLQVLHRLVDAGHSVMVIEHNLDVIADADWVLDLGPEGGSAGGEINGEGDPEVIAGMDTETGRVLRGHFS
jgi:excinuclease ABC subunit A